MSHRAQILGIPVGRRRPDLKAAVAFGIGAVAAVVDVGRALVAGRHRQSGGDEAGEQAPTEPTLPSPEHETDAVMHGLEELEQRTHLPIHEVLW